MSFKDLLKLPDLGDFSKIGENVANFTRFGEQALLTIIQNQHAIHTRLTAIEGKLGIPAQPTLLPGPEPVARLNGAAPPDAAPQPQGDQP